MADLTGKEASQSVIVSGANPSTGVETNYLDVDSNGKPTVKINDGSGNSLSSTGGSLNVNITGGAGSGGTAQADKSTFTEGTTQFTPVGGVFNDTISADPTEDQAAAARITSKRAVHTNLRNNSGTEIATSSNPLRVDPTGTTTQPISASSLPLPTGAATETTLSAINTKLVSGNDIGDVTVNNAAGASAVNIQDGGNSITVDQATAANLNATVRNQDGAGNNITSVSIDGNRGFHVAQLEAETFTVISPITAIGNNKSMISILNAGGSDRVVKIREMYIINSQTTAVVGIAADFRLFRITGHSAGTALTPEAHDSNDTLSGSVTVRTGATIAGEAASYSRRWLWSSDEWGPGTLDTEGSDHSLQNLLEAYQSRNPKIKPLTLNAGQGIHIKQVVNSTAGTFDLVIVFTQE